MLQALRVRHLAILEAADLAFGPGLTVMTGETGAGKSIVVGALGLLLGARADRGQIRAGADACTVEAEFRFASAELNALLDELGLPPCEDGQLLVRRIVAAAGTGRQWVNGSATTLQGLRRVGDLLVDLHGPHEHQSLLNPEYQLSLLDAFAHLEVAKGPYAGTYADILTLRREAEGLQGDDRELAQIVDLLRYQVQEIDAAELTDLDEDALEAEHALLANAAEILTLGQGIAGALTEDDTCAFNRLVDARRQLEAMRQYTEEAAAWQKEAEAIASRMQALASGLERRLQAIEVDPERLGWIENRMAQIHRLKRKYGGSLPEILQFREDASERLQSLTGRSERLATIEGRLRKAQRELQKHGNDLTTERRKAAAALEKAVTVNLRELGFPHGEFRIAIEAGDPRPTGVDRVEFGFAPNVGEPMRPLRLIASSGEISRVMLATKAVLAAHDRVPVLVFDEVDANVGGEMGVAIGAKLLQVAAGHQVVCITHLPQVAVCGHHHVVVTKDVTDGRTYTRIATLDGKAREGEVARMLGGKDLTSVTLKHARELLTKGRPAKPQRDTASRRRVRGAGKETP